MTNHATKSEANESQEKQYYWARDAPRDERGRLVRRDVSPPSPQTIIELIDQHYPEFNEPSWATWRAFLKALFGLEMTDNEQVLFRQFTKRDTGAYAGLCRRAER